MVTILVHLFFTPKKFNWVVAVLILHVQLPALFSFLFIICIICFCFLILSFIKSQSSNILSDCINEFLFVII